MTDEDRRRIAAKYVDDPAQVDDFMDRISARLEWRRQRGHKVCSTCKQKKKPEEFGLDGSRSDGLEPRCRACRSAR